jgi:hypothetical protein
VIGVRRPGQESLKLSLRFQDKSADQIIPDVLFQPTLGHARLHLGSNLTTVVSAFRSSAADLARCRETQSHRPEAWLSPSRREFFGADHEPMPATPRTCKRAPQTRAGSAIGPLDLPRSRSSLSSASRMHAGEYRLCFSAVGERHHIANRY